MHRLFPSSTILLTLAAVLDWRWLPLIYIRLAAGVMFTFSAALVLSRGDHHRYKISAYLTALSLFLYGLFTLGHFVSGLIFPGEVMPVPTLSGTIYTLALFVLSYLWTAGFILMVNQRLQSDLSDLAMNDALTRVRNRRAMQNMLDFEMNRIDKGIKDFSILLLDIDHFKLVNDTHGHDAGDAVLKWLASTLQNNARPQDIVARWGGEEFLVLTPATTLEDAMNIAERLRVVVAESVVELPSTTLKITFSGGISNSSAHRDVNRLCKIADQALYVAKQTRNRIVSQEALPPSELNESQ